MPDTEIRDKVNLHHTVLFGAENQGGLVREVGEVKKQITECEQKINTISGKWLALMTLLAVAGQFLARALIH